MSLRLNQSGAARGSPNRMRTSSWGTPGSRSPRSSFSKNSSKLIRSSGIGSQVLEVARELPEGAALIANELLHLGNRATVDQALSRLAKHGLLTRVSRGVYVVPTPSRFGPRLPSPAKLAQSVAERRGEGLVRHGAAAADGLGLTTQVPVREVYLTGGPSRKVQFGRQTVEFHHAPPWQLRLPVGRTGDALRALAWLGPENAHAAIGRLKNELTPTEVTELLAERRKLPTWVAQEVSRLADDAA